MPPNRFFYQSSINSISVENRSDFPPHLAVTFFGGSGSYLGESRPIPGAYCPYLGEKQPKLRIAFDRKNYKGIKKPVLSVLYVIFLSVTSLNKYLA
jgi:hypothetical protein